MISSSTITYDLSYWDGRPCLPCPPAMAFQSFSFWDGIPLITYAFKLVTETADPFSNPRHICIFDGFDDSQIDTLYVWEYASSTGSTAIAETGSPLGVLKVTNPGTGTAGYARIVSNERSQFGRHMSISVDIQINTGDQAADGEMCCVFLMLYVNDSNYIIFGAYRDTSSPINTIGYVGTVTNTVWGGPGDVSSVVQDNDKRNYTILVTDSHVLFYIDYVLVHSCVYDHLFNIGYYVHLYASTQDNTDVIDIDFDNFLAVNESDPLLIKNLSGVVP